MKLVFPFLIFTLQTQLPALNERHRFVTGGRKQICYTLVGWGPCKPVGQVRELVGSSHMVILSKDGD